MKNKSNSKRTEATLSLLVTSALVITLAIAVASAIKKGNVNEENNNIVNLNETEAPSLSANNSQSQIDTKSESLKNNSTDNLSNKIASDKNTQTNDTKNNSTETKSDNSSHSRTAQSTDNSSEDATDLSEVPVAMDSSITAEYSFSETDTLIMPASGEIILSYNMDNTIWFPTLSVYKCNPGLYIAGEVGSEVVAAASGRVESITQNEEYGNVVTLNMGNGYVSSYGMLGDIQVSEGEVVLAGSTIGTIAEPTIYFTTEGSGVYFKLTKDNVPTNPLDYME